MVKNSGFWMRQASLLPINKVLNKRTWIWYNHEVCFITKPANVFYTSPSRYRPNTLTSYVRKTVEKNLLKRVTGFLEIIGQLDDNQESFRKQTSNGRFFAENRHAFMLTGKQLARRIRANYYRLAKEQMG